MQRYAVNPVAIMQSRANTRAFGSPVNPDNFEAEKTRESRFLARISRDSL